MKILVTGSNGLLGSALKKILGENHIYHTRNDADLLNWEETFDFFQKKIVQDKVDTVIHAAAKVGGVSANMNNNEVFFEQNYVINNNVISACSKLGVSTFVNILSTCIFPHKNITYPLTANQINNGEPHPSNFGYSYAKRLSGYETTIFRNVLQKNWFSVVPTNLYGPNDNFDLENGHLIPSMIHRAYLAKKNNEKFVIWGDGSPMRQFVYSEDMAKLILWTIENWKSEKHCMLVDEKEYSVLEIAHIISKKFGFRESDLVFDETKPRGQFRKPASSDIKNFEFKSIESGIDETIDWFIKNYNNIRK